MHELAIAESVVACVLERTGDRHVSVVRLRVGRLAGVVPDDLDSRRLHPNGEQGAREEGAIQIGALAPHQLAAGDDDHRPRAAWA